MASITSSTSTPTLSSLGVGRGLTPNRSSPSWSRLSDNPSTSFRPKRQHDPKQNFCIWKIQSAVSSLRDAAAKADQPRPLGQHRRHIGGQPVAFSTTTGAAPGNYNVSVSSLAAGQSVLSNTVLSAPSSTLGSGTLTFEVGSWSGSTFTGKTGATAVNVAIDAADSLETIRDKINNANAGVKATIINDASGARLVMNSPAPA